MRLNETFIDDLIELTVEDLLEQGISDAVAPDLQIPVLKDWVRELEDDGPQNRAERVLFEHLEAAIDRLAKKAQILASS